MPEDLTAGLLQYGALGILAVILILYARGAIAREQQRSDNAEKTVKELQDKFTSSFLPALIESNRLHSETADILQQALTELREFRLEREVEHRRRPQ